MNDIRLTEETDELLTRICKMTGKDPNEFAIEAVRAAMEPYLDRNHEFHPREAILHPSEYEKKAVATDGSRAAIIRLECYALDTVRKFGKPYVKLYDPVQDTIIQAPKEQVELVEK